jgi:glycosyltransferase involved in cell wall biosynthesis
LNVGLALLTLRPGQVGGSETHVRGLLGALGGDPGADGNRYVAVTGPAARSSLAALERGPVSVIGVPGWRVGSTPARILLAVLRGRYAGARLRRAAESSASGPFDVVHYPLTVAVPRVPSPRVVTIHDLQHELMPDLFSRAERAYRRVFYAGAIREAEAVVTISNWVKETIVERHGIDPERVSVCFGGVDREAFGPEEGPDDAERVARLGLPERFVVYPANLWRHKNHDRLVDALALASDRELELVLTGQDFGRWPRLRERAKAAGVGDRVRHLGYVERSDLPALYRRSLGMVFPSLFEGLGIPPLEALACGRPVAAANRTALSETLRGRALLFEPESQEAIAHALDALGSASIPMPELDRAFWERFTWDAAAEVYRRAYGAAAARAAG